MTEWVLYVELSDLWDDHHLDTRNGEKTAKNIPNATMSSMGIYQGQGAKKKGEAVIGGSQRNM